MLILRLKVFFQSLWFHIYRGFPKSTKDEILVRYNICISCEEYDKNRSVCNVCGCNIGNKKTFLNKLAWADQECPVGKWPRLR